MRINYTRNTRIRMIFGLSSMLWEYGIKNTGISIEEKDDFDLFVIEAPFIANSHNDFVVVTRISADKVTYIWNGIKIEISLEEFKKGWTGVILLAEPDKESIEPDYEENRKKDFYNYVLISVLGIIVLVSVVYALGVNQTYTNPGLILSLLLSIFGLYISLIFLGDDNCLLYRKSISLIGKRKYTNRSGRTRIFIQSDRDST